MIPIAIPVPIPVAASIVTTATTTAAVVFILLAVGHSALGERALIGPLTRADWAIDEMPRHPANRLLRGAWHLTSIAWLGLAAIALDVDPFVVLGAVGLASALMIGLNLPGHFAWPLFLLAGFAALHHAEALPAMVLRVGAVIAAIALLGAAGLHVYWASGGRRFADAVIPNAPAGQETKMPGPLPTLMVAVALVGAALAVIAYLAEIGPRSIRWIVVATTVAFVVRAIGDGRQVGFSKRDRSTQFAINDDRWFTPLVTLLAFGVGAALLV